MLVEDGIVQRVSAEDTQTSASNIKRIDAGGGTLLPGLVDSHCHPFELGWLRRNVDLRGTANTTALRLRVEARVHRSAPGEWVVGMGWDHELFPDRKLPSRADIDSVTADNPAILGRVCGHIGLVNTKAIQALGLDAGIGEEYERDPRGMLTGIIKERALVGAYSRIPGKSASACAADLSEVEYETAKLGLTTLHTIVSQDEFREEIDALVSLAFERQLLLRHRAYIPPEAMDYVKERGIAEKLKGTHARLNGVKLYADGSLGAKTAALREPYADDPGNTGILRYSDEELSEHAVRAASAGYQVIIHAIGDRAVEQAIAALSRICGGGNPMRHRVEHASLLPRDLRGKMKKLGIRAAFQPCFITSDTWAESRLGPERVADLYPFKSAMSDGIIVSGGSDAPVESFSPILGMWAAMTRGAAGGNEIIGIEEAVALYTSNGLTNGLDEPWDRIRAGSPATLTLLDSDIRDMHPALLRRVSAAATIVDGELVYSAFD